MAESADADSAHYYTLNARPYYFPTDRPDARLSRITPKLLELPPEIRSTIFEYAFTGNRVVVTAKVGCYCASDGTGPYRADHKWLLNYTSGHVKQDAQRAFIRLACWELHCDDAFTLFVHKMMTLRCLESVRHIRINVFETTRQWHLPIEHFPELRSITFSPWQKGWTIDIPAQEDAADLSDVSIVRRLRQILAEKDGYQPVARLLTSTRNFTLYFVFPIRYLLPDERLPWRWQLRVRKTFRVYCNS